MSRQPRFSFVDPLGRHHSLVLLSDSGASAGAAVLDGRLAALRVDGRSAEYRRLDLSFSLRSNLFRTAWTLACGSKRFAEQPPAPRLTTGAVGLLQTGPANGLVDEAAASAILRRAAGRGPDGRPLPAEARDASEFHEMLEEFTPRRFVTPGIVGLNVLVFLLMAGSRIDGAEDLLRWGALYSPLVNAGQAWRVVTSTFIHFGFLHLFFNMLLFVGVARVVERFVGNVGFALLYLVSGILGGVASLHFNPGLLGGGASGAVFGVLGGVLGLMRRYHVYIHFKDILKVAVLVALLLADNVLENRNRPVALGRIDLAAHVGGLLGGLACGLVLCQRVGPAVPAGRRVRNLAVAAGGLLVGFAGVSSAPRVDDVLAEIRIFTGTDDRLESEAEWYVSKMGQRQGDPVQMADDLQRRIIPEWSRACGRLDALSRIPRFYRDFVDALKEYGRVRGEGWTILLDAARANDSKRLTGFREKNKAADAVLVRFLLSRTTSERR